MISEIVFVIVSMEIIYNISAKIVFFVSSNQYEQNEGCISSVMARNGRVDYADLRKYKSADKVAYTYVFENKGLLENANSCILKTTIITFENLDFKKVINSNRLTASNCYSERYRLRAKKSIKKPIL